MKSKMVIVFLILTGTLLAGCDQRKPLVTTSGTVTVEVDESVSNVVKHIASGFEQSYPDAKIDIRVVEGREAITNFINDSVKVIVSARAFNDEELDVLKRYPDIEWKSYRCAIDAIAVIGHRSNPQKELRLTELDSIFQGSLARWKWNGKLIDVAVGDVNSSVNEVFRKKIMNNKPFTLSAARILSSDSLVTYVENNPNAIGIVGLNWLRGREDQLTVFALGQPGVRPDTTEPVGRFYTPHQAHIHRNYYPITRPVYLYSRAYGYTVATGFIAHITSIHGQQRFLSEGLVPVTMPIRLVETTSKQVQ
ncbi:hypothetical protein FBQ87_04015 [Sphingobacteriales bacterium CHB3]|nr:hypothetical protein [Sphingobacteriales bacterium CHB3]